MKQKKPAPVPASLMVENGKENIIQLPERGETGRDKLTEDIFFYLPVRYSRYDGFKKRFRILLCIISDFSRFLQALFRKKPKTHAAPKGGVRGSCITGENEVSVPFFRFFTE